MCPLSSCVTRRQVNICVQLSEQQQRGARELLNKFSEVILSISLEKIGYFLFKRGGMTFEYLDLLGLRNILTSPCWRNMMWWKLTGLCSSQNSKQYEIWSIMRTSWRELFNFLVETVRSAENCSWVVKLWAERGSGYFIVLTWSDKRVSGSLVV